VSGFFVEQARRMLAARDLEGALEACRRAVAATATDAEAWFMKGTVELALGRPSEAVASAREAVRVAPADARYWTLAGSAEQDAGRLAEARDAYQQATRAAPQWALGWHRLGTVCFELGHAREAEEAFERAVACDPGQVRAWNNLGHARIERGRLDEAEVALRQALALQPDYALAFYNLARVARARGEVARALEYGTLAARLDAALVDAEILAVEMLRRTGDAATAKERLEALVDRNPNHVPARCQLGELLWEAGFAREGREQYRLARRVRPASLRAALGSSLLLPPVYSSSADLEAWRTEYAAGLDELGAEAAMLGAESREAVARDAQWSNFYLAYQGREDAGLQRDYGRFIASVLRARFPERYAELPRRAPRARPRIGFFSHFFFNCTAGRYFKSWITDLDRSRFEVFTYYTNDWVADDTREIAAASDTFRHCRGMALQELARTVAEDELDVLVYPELGMHAATFALASMRLAPVQACAWGHPVTSGHANIDRYLSVAAMEPRDAQGSYVERLHTLPGLGTRYEAPRAAPAAAAQLGLPSGRNLYLVPQSLFKIHPDNDALLAGVLDADPEGHLVVFEARQPAVTQAWLARMARALGASPERARERIAMLPYMPHERFLQVNAACDVMLDTLHWSGGNTSLDALAAGLPVVTSPGAFMRGRQSAAMLSMLGLEAELVVAPGQYVERAVALGRDESLRRGIAERMRARHGELFGRRDAVPALQDFLAAVAA
jgi:predicted O-linked N-acetylglucosamine transferase (SPINDLY family)